MDVACANHGSHRWNNLDAHRGWETHLHRNRRRAPSRGSAGPGVVTPGPSRHEPQMAPTETHHASRHASSTTTHGFVFRDTEWRCKSWTVLSRYSASCVSLPCAGAEPTPPPSASRSAKMLPWHDAHSSLHANKSQTCPFQTIAVPLIKTTNRRPGHHSTILASHVMWDSG